MEYTNSEYCDMLLILGQCNNEAIVAARRYAEIYSHGRMNLKINNFGQVFCSFLL